VTLQYVAPNNLQMPHEITQFVHQRGIKQIFATSFKEVLPTTDVLYMTRIQRERFDSESEYQNVSVVGGS